MAIQSLFLAARSRAFALGVLFLTLFTVGCTDPNHTEPIPVTASVWTFNEGQYPQDNASITPYDPIGKKASPEDLFSSVNNLVRLGNIPTSAVTYNNKLFVSISGSGKIYILDPVSGKLVGKIIELDSPRHIYIVNETKGYISNLYLNELTIFNPTTLAVTGKIELESAAESFVKTSEGLFVNLWSFGKKIAKIDTNTDKVLPLIEVGVQPVSMAADKNNNLWVACDGGWPGNSAGEEKPSLSKMNSRATSVLHKWELPAGGFSFRVVAVDGGAAMLVLSGNVYKVAADATTFSTTPFITLPAGVVGYSMGVDPENGDIYVGDAVDYQQRGTVYRYNKEGVQIDKYTAGVVPAFFYFQPKQ